MQFHARKNRQSSSAKLEGTKSPVMDPARLTRTETSAAPIPVSRNYSSRVNSQ